MTFLNGRNLSNKDENILGENPNSKQYIEFIENIDLSYQLNTF